MTVIKTKEIPHTSRNKYFRVSSTTTSNGSSSSINISNLNGIDTEVLKMIIKDLSNRIYYLEKDIFDSVSLTPPDYFYNKACYVQRFQSMRSGGIYKTNRSGYPKFGSGYRIVGSGTPRRK